MSAPADEGRLGLLARYARVVVAQEQRLEAGDEEGFTRHAEERRALQERVDALPPSDPATGVDPARRDEVLRLLERARASDARIRERMREGRSRSRSELGNVQRRGDQARRYLAAGAGVERTVDVTL